MQTKTINEFYDDMLAAKQSQASLAVLTSTSKVSIWRLLLYIAAVGAWILQGLFQQHYAEVQTILIDYKPATVRWYRTKSLDFQYGQNLIANDIVYDNTGLAEEDIALMKVVKHCDTSAKLRGVRVKVAGENESGVLQPLTAPQVAAFAEYLERVKSPGVRIYIINNAADWLQLNLQIYYDPLVLSADGKRLDGTNDEPVQKAIESFLKKLPFDGLFTLMQLVDALQAVSGVVIPHIVSASASYASLNYMPIEVSYLPDAGYMILKELTASYLPQSAL